MEAWKKIQNRLKKTKCLTIRAGRQKHEQIEEEVKEGKIDEVASYMVLIQYRIGIIMLNKEGT